MTIPIVPGPWAFLESAGQGLGNYGDIRHQRQQEEMDRARQTIMDAIMMRQQFGDPSLTAGQGVQDAAGRLGYSLPGQATPNEMRQDMIRGILGRYAQPEQQVDFQMPMMMTPGSTRVKGSIPNVTDEERMIAQIPSRSSVSGERLAQTVTNAQIPGAAPTVVAGQERERQQAIDPVTDEVVARLWEEGGFKRLPSASEAFQAGSMNDRARRMGNSITRDSYARAIARLKAMLDAQGIDRARIWASAYGGSPPDLLARLTAEKNQLTKELDDLGPTAAILGNTRVDEINTRLAQLETEYNAEYQRQRGSRQGGLPQAPGGPSPATPAGIEQRPDGSGTGRTAPPAAGDRKAMMDEYTVTAGRNTAKFGTGNNLTEQQKDARRKLLVELARKHNINLGTTE